ncbi:uncharacterized protein TNCV_2081661 [Trichonephila clavipes]|nr:uncharacterized protein TNCV_2081661 [Trichonephila clavipes]
MQYLLQSVEPKSKSERLVLSFPATAENYPKAIDQLKERFGREDLLVQIYVRELLNLVMKNAVSGRTKTDLCRPCTMNLKGNYGRCGEPWTNTRKIWRFPYTIGRVLLTRGNPDGLGKKTEY